VKKVSPKVLTGAQRKGAPEATAETLGRWISQKELDHLQDQLQEARDTLEAIRGGEVDAVVVSGSSGNQIYSLTGAEQPYRVYVEQMQEGAVTVSDNGLVLYCNQRFAEMVKAPLECVIGANILPHLSANSWEEISSVFRKKEQAVKHEGTLQCRDGTKLPVQLTASLLPLRDQVVICLIVTDLSLQKRQEKLRLAKEVAEEANVAKDSFLAALSHELRTPLTPALMALFSLERDQTLADSAKRDVSMIRANIQLETRLIDDLLDLTRIAQGKLELDEGPLDVHAVLLRAIDICRPEIETKQQKLTLNIDAHRSKTIGDTVRIQQVMWNLIRNAVKFTPPGGSVTISTQNVDQETVRVCVEDSGIGFQSEIAPKLFVAFEQNSRNITRQFGGLGLGLSISRSIVLAHGGTIQAESAGPKKGATFTIELPLRKGAQTSISVEPPSLSSGGRILRILLVEDHDDTRIAIEGFLRNLKHEIRSAGTAQGALELASQHQFDLVLSDLGLPDENGLELMSKLRDRFGLRGIAVSGFGMKDDIERSLEAGFIYHLTKPIDPNRLGELLSKIA
jgi:PAS domain S-box-containing protein